jgi:hypothetical protein
MEKRLSCWGSLFSGFSSLIAKPTFSAVTYFASGTI